MNKAMSEKDNKTGMSESDKTIMDEALSELILPTFTSYAMGFAIWCRDNDIPFEIAKSTETFKKMNALFTEDMAGTLTEYVESDQPVETLDTKEYLRKMQALGLEAAKKVFKLEGE
jgi:hypothetical protein